MGGITASDPGMAQIHSSGAVTQDCRALKVEIQTSQMHPKSAIFFLCWFTFETDSGLTQDCRLIRNKSPSPTANPPFSRWKSGLHYALEHLQHFKVILDKVCIVSYRTSIMLDLSI